MPPQTVQKPTTVHVQVDPQIEDAIEKYTKKMVRDFPGVRWDRSAVVRNLLIGALQAAGAMK